MCKVLEVSKSSYYYIGENKLGSRYIRREELIKKIKKIYFSSKKIYGAPKIHKELLKSGEKCSLKLVQRIMKKEGLRSIVIKRYRPLSKNISREEIGRNILSRDFSSNAPGTKIVGDITYIHTVNDGWCYLASFMDLYSKKIVGWAYGKRMSTELVLKALDQVSSNVSIKADESILHTDLGSQYTSKKYIKRAKELKFKLSYSRKGNPYDNACIESFHAILKKECVYIRKLKDFESSKLIIFEFIESWYNRRRSHSQLGYLSPEEFEKRAA
jgi:transposase InsO family protein